MKVVTDLVESLDIHLFTVGGVEVRVATLIYALAALVGGLVVSRLARAAMTRAFRRRGLHDDGSVRAVARLLHYLIILSALGIALDTLGVNLGALFAAGAILAVGVGFAMQTIVQNFVSGVILLVERAIKPGDVLVVESRMVRVVDLGIRSTVVRTRDDEDLIVPNSTLVQGVVTNFTLHERLLRLRTTVGVAYSSDMRVVEQALAEAAAELEERAPDRDPIVRWLGFGSSSVDFEVSVWTTDPWERDSVRSQLYEKLWFGLKAHGVTIAFPQLDVHFQGAGEAVLTQPSA